MKKTLLAAFSVLLLVSCITQTNVPGYHKDINKFEVGQTYTTEIGNPVLFREEGYFLPAILILETPTPKKPGYKTDVAKGSIYVHKMSTAGKDLYYHASNTGRAGIAIDKKTGEAKVFVSIPEYQELASPLRYENYNYPEPGKTGFRQEFLYNGKSASTVKFTYREYSNDYARPAFTQDIQYDLNESKTIGFKGARIEVKDANNYSINFTVKKDFDKQ